jgi:hypothetical protein
VMAMIFSSCVLSGSIRLSLNTRHPTLSRSQSR